MEFKGYFETCVAVDAFVTVPLRLRADEYDALQMLAVDNKLGVVNYLRLLAGLSPPSKLPHTDTRAVGEYLRRSPEKRYRHIARLSTAMRLNQRKQKGRAEDSHKPNPPEIGGGKSQS